MSKAALKVAYVAGLYLIGSPMCRTMGFLTDEDGRRGYDVAVGEMLGTGGAGEPDLGVNDATGVPGGMGVFVGSAMAVRRSQTPSLSACLPFLLNGRARSCGAGR